MTPESRPRCLPVSWRNDRDSRADELSADRLAAIEGVEQATDLVTVADVAPLDFREGHVAAVDVVEDGGEFHDQASLRQQQDPCSHRERNTSAYWSKPAIARDTNR